MKFENIENGDFGGIRASLGGVDPWFDKCVRN
jgi:hypothetical protein